MSAHVSDAVATLLSQPPAQRSLGPYQLTEPLGKGGFAPVWLAREVFGGSELRSVAVKLFGIHSRAPAKPGVEPGKVTASQRARIIEEARALCRVEHPNVVRFNSIVTNADETVLGLVMEHVQGRSLDERLARGGSVSLGEVLDVGIAIASALAAVHRAGLIHRDVKPHNVVDAFGVYKLIDFGIAAADEGRGKQQKKVRKIILDDLPLEVVGSKLSALGTRAPKTLGRTGALVVGTVGYIDPASVGAPPTPASDLYSLGAMLYECLTGAVPAHAAARVRGGAGLLGEVLDGRAAPPRADLLKKSSPAALVDLLAQLLEPDARKRPPSAEAVVYELERIRLAIRGTSRPLPAEEQGPFRGLGRFELADRDVFFGRSVEVAAAVEILRGRSLLALIGASGSGKSSLARAGVVPAVVDGTLGAWPTAWRPIVTSPGPDPAAQVRQALREVVPDIARKAPHAVADALRQHARSTGTGVLLFIDQLEELCTIAEAGSRDWVVKLLGSMAAPLSPGVRAMVAARRDLLDPLLALGELGPLLTKGTMLVSPVSRATWAEVLDQALMAYGYRLQDESMRDELLDGLGDGASAMPLVQFALTELWNRRNVDRKLLTRAALDAIGGVAGALDMHAERVRSRILESRGDAGAIHTVVMALTTAQGTRRTVPLSAIGPLESPAEVRRVVEVFERERLFVCEGSDVTLAHEALLSQWKRLRRWIAAAREDRVLADEVEREAAAWAEDESAERVWRRRRLFVAEDLALRGQVRLSSTALDFIRAGQRAEWSGRLLALALVGCVIAAAGIAGYKYVEETRNAEARIRIEFERAEAQRLVAEQQRLETENALGLANQSYDVAAKAKESEKSAKDQFRTRLEQLEEQVQKAKTLAEWRALQDKVAAEKSEDAPAPAPPPGPWSPKNW